jgi:hypothetical protein
MTRPARTPGEVYTCENCGGRFRFNGQVCLVRHFPGECCHYGDTDLLTGRNARAYDPKAQDGVRKPGERWRD